MPAAASMKRPNLLQIWLRAVRAPALIAAIIPVLLGGGLALINRGFDGWAFLAAMVAVMLIQAGSHLFNDYYDYFKGGDDGGSLSPPSVIQKAWLRPRTVYIGGLVCYVTAALIGSWLVYIGGLFILFLGLLGLVCGYVFTGTRWALAYHRLGEVTVFLLSGPLVVLGTYFVMLKIIYMHVILNGVSIGLLAAALLHLNNLRDLEHDKQIGKHTLATMLGSRKAKGLFYLLLLIAYLLPVALLWYDLTPAYTLLVLLTLPLAIRAAWIVQHTDDPVELNLALGHAVLLQLLFGMLHAFGIFLYYFINL